MRKRMIRSMTAAVLSAAILPAASSASTVILPDGSVSDPSGWDNGTYETVAIAPSFDAGTVPLTFQITMDPDGGAGTMNAGIRIGDLTFLFHPGFAGSPVGAFRVNRAADTSILIANQSMGAVPSLDPFDMNVRLRDLENGNYQAAVRIDFTDTGAAPQTYTGTFAIAASEFGDIDLFGAYANGSGAEVNSYTNASASDMFGRALSVNFYNDATYQVTGTAGEVPLGNWNNFASGNTGTSKTVGGLTDQFGVNTGASITVDAQHAWQSDTSTATQNSTMQSSYLDTGGDNAQITLEDLPGDITAPGYMVILYLRGTDAMGANTPAEFGAAIDGEQQWIRWLRNTVDGGFDLSLFTDESTAQASSADLNMLVFDNGGQLYHDSTLVIDLLRDPDSTATWARGAIAGIQIIAMAPSPAALPAGLMLMVALGARRRRR